MPNAIFVSLSQLYPQLDRSAQQDKGSAALRDVTCAWWEISPVTAAGVRYAFGVFEGAVVSAYAVEVPASDWPVMPSGAIAAGKRYIPVKDLTERDRTTATSWTGIAMFGPMRYGSVSLDSNNAITGYALAPMDDSNR